MSAVLAHAAGVLAAWRVQPGALMLLGRAPGPLPASGVAQVPGTAQSRGAFRAVAWPVDGGYAFLAAVRLPDHADPDDGAAVLLRAATGTLTLELPGTSTPDAAFGQHVAALAGPHGAEAARFVLDALRPPASAEAPLPHLATMLRAFLSAAAAPDGCIEIMCAVPDGCVLLQGWGAPLAGGVQVVLAGAAMPCFAGQAGEFARADTALPATGVMLMLPPAALAALPGTDHVFILSASGLHSRTLVEQRLLNVPDSLGHIRHMLPGLRCPPPMAAVLHDVLRPRFDGHDTLHTCKHPVRAALDMAAAGAGAGAYVSGWVFDPAGRIAALHLCGTGGYAARLDTHWTRIPRPDVTDAFRGQAAFPAPPSDDAGFAVSVPATPTAGEAVYLQVTFTDGDRAFMPVATADPADPGLRARLLAGIDLYKPSGLPVVEEQAGPFMARVTVGAPALARVALRGPVDRPHAVVVPLPAPVLPRSLLSGFLHDPLGATEQLVLACGPEWGADRLDALRALLAFHGLPASILHGTDTPTALAALREAARATAADTFLLLAPGVAATSPGWRGVLRRAAAEAAFACPTLLYEDWSVRYAGQGGLRVTGGPPYAEPHMVMAGMPAGLVTGDAPSPTHVGTLDCCALRRAVLGHLDGTGALVTAAAQEAAFFGRLRAAGPGLWVPGVQAYAPEAPDTATPAARLCDGWVLRHQHTPQALDGPPPVPQAGEGRGEGTTGTPEAGAAPAVAPGPAGVAPAGPPIPSFSRKREKEGARLLHGAAPCAS